MAKKIKIRRNVPIPPLGNTLKGEHRKGSTIIYPWKQLNVGDCFITDGTVENLSSLVYKRNKAHREQYVKRRIDGKIWVWRIK